jgi:hypothetical protein
MRELDCGMKWARGTKYSIHAGPSNYLPLAEFSIELLAVNNSNSFEPSSQFLSGDLTRLLAASFSESLPPWLHACTNGKSCQLLSTGIGGTPLAAQVKWKTCSTALQAPARHVTSSKQNHSGWVEKLTAFCRHIGEPIQPAGKRDWP